MVKSNFALLLLIFVIGNVVGYSAHAFTLEEVRNITRKESAKTLSEYSNKRIENIRKELKTQNLSISSPEALIGLPSNRERGESSSDYIKFFFRKVMVRFSELVRYGNPQVVDPSTMWHEFRQKEDNYYSKLYDPVLAQINKELKTDVQQILLGYNSIVVEKSKKDLVTSCANLTNNIKFRGNSSDLPLWFKAKSLLETYIQNHSKAMSALGSIWRLDIVRGRIQRIRFTNCEAANFDSQVTLTDVDNVMLNLSSAISIYTGLDEIFIETQRQFLKVVQEEIEKLEAIKEQKTTKIVIFSVGGLSPDEEVRLKIFKDVRSSLDSKIAGAIHFNKKMNTLSKYDQGVLLDLLLQLNRDEIPSDKDIIAMRDYHEEIYGKMQKDSTFAKEYASTVKQFELAFKYYQALHYDLNLLENDLVEKKAGRNFLDVFKKDLRK